LPKISGFIATKVSPTAADYANKDISGQTAGGMSTPLDDDQDGIYASHVHVGSTISLARSYYRLG